MARAYIDGEFVELTAEQIAEMQASDTQFTTETNSDIDRVQQLAAGLSTAKTIAEIRTAAKQILDETGGGESNE